MNDGLAAGGPSLEGYAGLKPSEHASHARSRRAAYGPLALNCVASFFVSIVKAVCQHSVETPSLARHWMEDAKGLQ